MFNGCDGADCEGDTIDTDIHYACSRRLCTFLPEVRSGTGPRAHRTLHLKRGERLETAGDGCLRFWVMVRGTAAVCTTFPDGRRQITGLERAGDTICGPMAATETPSWLEAMDDCIICELDFSHQAATLQRDPKFLDAMFRVVHRRLEAASRQLATLGRLDSTERVVLFLAEMALKANANGPQTRPVRLPMSREDIADYLGLNAETVSRIMARLKKSGMFKFLSPTEYVLTDLDAVERRLPIPVPRPMRDVSIGGGGHEAHLKEVGA
ncbi:Crp/Fnr family transcriptional regulator [Alisedimentitalea sp. MJ-SS2]|uniref:Crp/Fnr family transcriptional regulator n=1 Tax=Aliisedimentitalea sp. MJ-SS2 TaxID=3049795 RepID=UPI00291499AC|nr:Crp/Fnr family transcriptional regulator [Alisedimentitalea sp. MJ-SS2]MDU8929964.1 Crp/Fnr family transcriptional regulator [Alisedimentitalea sp. MJ-SS2]